MIEKAPVSACIIVKNEPLLEECIKSIRDFVKEIVIIDTGSSDGTAEVGKRLADVFNIYTDCNNPHTGLIEDFSKARQRSFDLANQPWVMWLDADDVVVGAENLLKLTNAVKSSSNPAVFLFPYEYSYNEDGKCICLHYRERLLFNKNNFHWVNPVHEVVVPNNGVSCTFINDDSVVYKHRRQYSSKKIESGRNLRILKQYFENVGESDPRQMYYLGLEYHNNGLVEESIKCLSRYVDISGWDDERAMACLKLIDIFQSRGQYDEGLKWAFKTVEIKENWGEGYFALGKMFYFMAIGGGPNEIRNWERCAYFCRTGLSLPPTKTLLFINPMEREFEIHKYLNVALSKLGDVSGALESVNTALKSQPNDAMLLGNKKIYEDWIKTKEVTLYLDKIKEFSDSNNHAKAVIDALDAANNVIVDGESQKWQIPDKCDVDGMPLKIDDEKLQACAIMFWKQYLLYNQIDEAELFLKNPPGNIKSHPNILKALEVTNNFKNKLLNVKDNIKSSNNLDIVFFAGDGVEIWNPETVKNTGIGGSELMLMELAKRLAKLGHKVRVYNSCGFFGEKVYDGVQYYQTEKFKDLECDVLVVSRRTEYLSDHFNIKSKIKLLWVHDIVPINYNNQLLLKADRILCLSDWHKQFVIDNCNVHPDHIIRTRNGVDLKRFIGKNIKRDKYKCICTSSPDRYLPVLLENIWPRIKEKVKDATLVIGYSFENWKFIAKSQNDINQLNLINSLENKIKEMEHLGVIYKGRMNQEELANELLSSSIWTFSTWFSETSCISAMEMQAAGVKMITSDIAALKETVGERGELIPGVWTSQEYQDFFVEKACQTLLSENNI